MHPLPFDPHRVNKALMQTGLPHRVNGLVPPPEIHPYLLPHYTELDGTLRNILQENAQGNALRTFLFNQMAHNGYNNQEYRQLIHETSVFAAMEMGSGKDPSTAINYAAVELCKYHASINAEYYPGLNGVLPVCLTESVQANIRLYKRLRESLMNYLNSNQYQNMGTMQPMQAPHMPNAPQHQMGAPMVMHPQQGMMPPNFTPEQMAYLQQQQALMQQGYQQPNQGFQQPTQGHSYQGMTTHGGGMNGMSTAQPTPQAKGEAARFLQNMGGEEILSAEPHPGSTNYQPFQDNTWSSELEDVTTGDWDNLENVDTFVPIHGDPMSYHAQSSHIYLDDVNDHAPAWGLDDAPEDLTFCQKVAGIAYNNKTHKRGIAKYRDQYFEVAIEEFEEMDYKDHSAMPYIYQGEAGIVQLEEPKDFSTDLAKDDKGQWVSALDGSVAAMSVAEAVCRMKMVVHWNWEALKGHAIGFNARIFKPFVVPCPTAEEDAALDKLSDRDTFPGTTALFRYIQNEVDIPVEIQAMARARLLAALNDLIGVLGWDTTSLDDLQEVFDTIQDKHGDEALESFKEHLDSYCANILNVNNDGAYVTRISELSEAGALDDLEEPAVETETDDGAVAEETTESEARLVVFQDNAYVIAIPETFEELDLGLSGTNGGFLRESAHPGVYTLIEQAIVGSQHASNRPVVLYTGDGQVLRITKGWIRNTGYYIHRPV